MGNTSPTKLFILKPKQSILLLIVIVNLIALSSGFKFVNRAVGYNKRLEMQSSYHSRLETTQQSSNTEDSGSIFDDQTVIIESKNTTSAETPQNTTPDSKTPSSSQNERLSHLKEVTEPTNEEATTTQNTTSTAEITTSKTKTEKKVVIKYVSLPNGYDFKVKPFNSEVLDDIYPRETKDMVTYGVELFAAFIAVLLIVKLFVVMIRNMSYFQMSQYKMKAVYAFLRDLTILIIIFAVLVILNYHHYLDFIHTNIWNILLGFGVFILLWIMFSSILLYTVKK